MGRIGRRQDSREACDEVVDVGLFTRQVDGFARVVFLVLLETGDYVCADGAAVYGGLLGHEADSSPVGGDTWQRWERC